MLSQPLQSEEETPAQRPRGFTILVTVGYGGGATSG
jgi:hypothetical protein